ncbi:MAG: hypothetical protein AAF405_01205 [Pseudomonadota bacterium]
MRGTKSCGFGLSIMLAFVVVAFMPTTQASAQSSSDRIGIELNKLNSEGDGCQAYFVFDNPGASEYRALKLDLVVFNPDDVIERRFAMDVAPLDAKKRTVKLFELKKMPCKSIGSFLINGVLECKQGTRTRSDCVGRLEPSSRVDVELKK